MTIKQNIEKKENGQHWMEQHVDRHRLLHNFNTTMLSSLSQHLF